MRSLVAQLVALALAITISWVSSSHPAHHPHPLPKQPRVVHHERSTCSAYCEARTLRHELKRVHGRTVALARRAALPVPPPPRLGWRRAALRVQLRHQAHVLGRYRTQARRPLRLRLVRFQAWVCIHSHEAAWNDDADPYWGGLQMDRGFMQAYGGDMIRRHHGGLADTWTPAEQIVVAERAYETRGFRPWPNTARSCGVL
jgi:hypothetical protein